MIAPIESVPAEKPNTFRPLPADELDYPPDIQSTPLSVRHGKRLIDEGQTGQKGLCAPERLGLQLQRLGQLWAANHLFRDRRCRAAQRAVMNPRQAHAQTIARKEAGHGSQRGLIPRFERAQGDAGSRTAI